MAMLQGLGIDDTLYHRLQFVAQRKNRTVEEQVISILQNYVAFLPVNPVKPKNATEEFLKLAGSWEDERSTDEIISDIYNSRENSTRFEALDGVFD